MLCATEGDVVQRLSMSSADVPCHQRLSFIHDVVGRHASGMCFNPADPARFEARFSIVPLGARAMVSQVTYDAFTASRSSELLADGRDDYQMLIGTAGFETEIEFGATQELAAGDLLLIDQQSRFVTRSPATRFDVAILPRRELAALVPGLGNRPHRAVRHDTPGLSLLAGYADLLRRDPPSTPDLARLAVDHLLRLTALALSNAPKDSAHEHAAALASARLALLKKTIRSRIDDPDLDLAAVARRHGISPRYVQQLFAREDTSFSDFVRAERLERAYSRLDDETNGANVADIAFDAGFADLSTFNRAFRRRYGCTPSHVRAHAHIRGTGGSEG